MLFGHTEHVVQTPGASWATHLRASSLEVDYQNAQCEAAARAACRLFWVFEQDSECSNKMFQLFEQDVPSITNS